MQFRVGSACVAGLAVGALLIPDAGESKPVSDLPRWTILSFESTSCRNPCTDRRPRLGLSGRFGHRCQERMSQCCSAQTLMFNFVYYRFFVRRRSPPSTPRGDIVFQSREECKDAILTTRSVHLILLLVSLRSMPYPYACSVLRRILPSLVLSRSGRPFMYRTLPYRNDTRFPSPRRRHPSSVSLSSF